MLGWGFNGTPLANYSKGVTNSCYALLFDSICYLVGTLYTKLYANYIYFYPYLCTFSEAFILVGFHITFQKASRVSYLILRSFLYSAHLSACIFILPIPNPFYFSITLYFIPPFWGVSLLLPGLLEHKNKIIAPKPQNLHGKKKKRSKQETQSLLFW